LENIIRADCDLPFFLCIPTGTLLGVIVYALSFFCSLPTEKNKTHKTCLYLIFILVSMLDQLTALQREKLKRIRFMATDVDGTLTDGGKYIDDHGVNSKRYSVRDGMGIMLLRQAGIEVAIITTDTTGSNIRRGEQLGLHHIITGERDKGAALHRLSAETGIPVEQMAFIGDDINDIPAFRVAGLSVAPADAMPDVLAMVDIVCTANGGHGAVRELCELILRVQEIPIVFA
jgi:3-deoxy-D-manno-octulosonate 8-phosphate phosphatase (KDO 8-P phosphatase)